ncbi:hypothetical protein EV175_000275 [Coemansia sp. RSA 1933]|nr:hypothetical protein EV175_000275 [Coemansia sp. RSA 1933]
MARGNQRELARQKQQKKDQKAGKGKITDDTPLVKKKERDADIMRKKQEASLAQQKKEEAAKQGPATKAA